jgi:hypothetical protein
LEIWIVFGIIMIVFVVFLIIIKNRISK